MKTAYSFTLTLVAIAGLVLVALLVSDPATRDTLIGVLTPIAGGGAFLTARGEPMKRKADQRGATRVEVVGVITAFALLALFAALLFSLGGCSTVEAHARKQAQIDVWPKSCRMIVTADGERVFVLTADPSVRCSLKCPEAGQ